MIERRNETVGDDDEVWVLGDFALGTIAETLPLAHRLRSCKVLVTGFLYFRRLTAPSERLTARGLT